MRSATRTSSSRSTKDVPLPTHCNNNCSDCNQRLYSRRGPSVGWGEPCVGRCLTWNEAKKMKHTLDGLREDVPDEAEVRSASVTCTEWTGKKCQYPDSVGMAARPVGQADETIHPQGDARKLDRCKHLRALPNGSKEPESWRRS